MRNVFNLIYIVLSDLYVVFVVSKFRYSRWLNQQIQELEREYGATLEVSYKKRLNLYMKITALLIFFLETLRGQRFTRQQKQITVLFSGLSAFFDDLFDEQHYSQAEILNVIQKKVQRNTLLEHICIGLFERIATLKNGFEWTATWQQVVDVQLASQQQVSGDKLTRSFLEKLTFDKGGASIVLSLETILGKEVSASELEVAHQLGGLIQLTNDIFDIHKDYTAKIVTLVTIETNMNQLKKFYEDNLTQIIQKFRLLPFSKKNIQLATLQYLIIISRGIVALEQLVALQHTTNNIFEVSKYSRKQLICDMELWQNLKKSFNYTLNWASKP